MGSALLSIHICMPLALVIVTIRLALRARRYKHKPPQTRARRHCFDAGDILCIVSIPFLIARWALTHLVITLGTSNISGSTIFKPGEAERRVIGSKCVLASRVAFATFVWSQKAILLVFYHRLLNHTSWGRPTLKLAWFILVSTYAAVQVTTFTECRPFSKYYTISKKPDKCVRAVVQLLVLGILSIFTDLLLIFLPIPVLWKIRQPFWQKLQLAFLFSLGIFVTLVTTIRVPQNFKNSTKQSDRTMWVSIEILVSAFVANMPTIYGLLRQRHAQKSSRYSWTGRLSHSNPEGNTSAEMAGTKPERFGPSGASQVAASEEELSVSGENAHPPGTQAHR
ncbi:MAG: hypothetical protein M1839_004591 [Geoglossum umbratile]|nr:MAG: hypothetical protein M1839_004591 [Geoglossum umbratile]